MDRDYPYCHVYSFITRGEPSGSVKGFVDHLMSEEGKGSPTGVRSDIVRFFNLFTLTIPPICSQYLLRRLPIQTTS